MARGGRQIGLDAIALLLPLGVFLSMFSNPDPERRFAPLFAILAIIAVPVLSSLSARGGIGLALVALLSGVWGLTSDFVDTVSTPFGLFSGPALLFLRLAFKEGRPLIAALLSSALLGLVLLAASKSLGQILEAPSGGSVRRE
jgi:hypothetical protein